ncbi:hypothetical protein E2C01_056328 [Portunus trituberculatus]|uniref:Uncharacterized protein n=1 Tax=Portunus trituberculatus TaxID=210409 RepID=A0A5B7GXS5_PORTR|nr:hypothetical protein [Portunus trituberculatus]
MTGGGNKKQEEAARPSRPSARLGSAATFSYAGYFRGPGYMNTQLRCLTNSSAVERKNGSKFSKAVVVLVVPTGGINWNISPAQKITRAVWSRGGLMV